MYKFKKQANVFGFFFKFFFLFFKRSGMILLDSEKALKNPVLQHDKNLERWGIQGTIKEINSKSIVDIKLNGKKFKAIPLKSRTRQGYLLSLNLFNIVVEVLAKVFRHLKESKGLQIRKDEVKVLLFVDDMIVYISNPKNPTRELVQLTNTFS